MCYPCDKSSPAEQPPSELACAYVYTDIPVFKHRVHREPREQEALPGPVCFHHLEANGFLSIYYHRVLGYYPKTWGAPQHICGPLLFQQKYLHATYTVTSQLLVFGTPNFQAPGRELYHSWAKEHKTCFSCGDPWKDKKPSRHRGENRAKGAQ